MEAANFFQNAIKDNNYQGIALKGNIVPSYRDDIYHNRKKNKEKFRKSGIANYLNELYQDLGTKKVKELNLSQVIFEDEYDANQDQKILEVSGNDFENLKIYTGNIVGSIIYKSKTFNINCRFGNEFLKYMIANTSGFLELENHGAINKDLGLGEWILVYYWKLQLKRAYSLGIYKTYRKRKEELPYIRGAININAFIKKPYFDGMTYCEFKEHSYKNELNAVIDMALTKVFKSKYQPIVSDIYDIKKAFDSINNKRLNLKDIRKKRVTNPYFKRYNDVFDLSLKILNNEFANVGDSNSEFSAFLFDISLLFEHHIRKLLKEKFELFTKNKKEFSIPNGVFENDIFPDVIIDYGNNNIGVYDVKYKNFNFINGVLREDRFQLMTYVAMHLGDYNVIDCGIIYPLDESNVERSKRLKKQSVTINKNEIQFKIKFYRVSEDIHRQVKLDSEFVHNFMNEKVYNEVDSELPESTGQNNLLWNFNTSI